ncbi:hypothetical protein [Arsenophonus sp. ENCA]|nr:hypothetical protein [Arsenophonus sp. ENCA]
MAKKKAATILLATSPDNITIEGGGQLYTLKKVHEFRTKLIWVR